MDWIPAEAANGIGIVGLVVLFAIGLATGRLYTRKTVDDLNTAHQRELDNMVHAHERELSDIAHDRDEWRTAHRISETARLEEREHSQALVTDIAATLKGFLEGFRQAASRSVPE